MEIIYLGHSSFKIKGKAISLITDPFSPDMVGLKYPKQEAEIVTVSHHHPDHDHLEGVTGVRKIIDGPGEYEISGVSILGFASFHDKKKGEERGKNTIYVFEIEGLRIAHLGDLGHTLSTEIVEDIGDIDVLMIPVGGVYTIDTNDAVDVAKAIEPNIIIPMHYKTEGMKDSFNELTDYQSFITQMGLSSETQPKLSIREGLPLDSEQKVIILERK